LSLPLGKKLFFSGEVTACSMDSSKTGTNELYLQPIVTGAFFMPLQNRFNWKEVRDIASFNLQLEAKVTSVKFHPLLFRSYRRSGTLKKKIRTVVARVIILETCFLKQYTMGNVRELCF